MLITGKKLIPHLHSILMFIWYHKMSQTGNLLVVSLITSKHIMEKVNKNHNIIHRLYIFIIIQNVRNIWIIVLAQLAITKCHRMGGLNNRHNLFSSRYGVWEDQDVSRFTVLLADKWPPSCCVSTWCREKESTLVTSSKPNYLQGPTFLYYYTGS